MDQSLVNSKASDFTARYMQLHRDTLLQDSLKVRLRERIDFLACSLWLSHYKLLGRGGRGIDADFRKSR